MTQQEKEARLEEIVENNKIGLGPYYDLPMHEHTQGWQNQFWLIDELRQAWSQNDKYRKALEEILSIQPSQKDLDDAGHGIKLEQLAEYRIARHALSESEGE